MLNPIMNIFILLVSLIVVYKWAPYNHPAMQLSKAEILACRKSARIRIVCLTVLGLICNALNYSMLAEGITLGIALAAFLLCLAYIMNGGNKNEQASGKNEESNGRTGSEND